ncbi:hypothetical protein LI82_02060 [Methanococcoides methylutens]|uniref:Uncharacterized protein n=1 Tax=Methanococcoides methylutens TaxID=2226 RepID=A0A099T5S4_METMT|nr:hypothetical protein [Methanococcoides methylutens]KGK99556.1 hypothetical protein LI82_02060 [Methanococcoides methylutens]
MNNKNILAIMSGLLVCLLLAGTAVAADPVVLSATTMDADGNGHIDAYDITFDIGITEFNDSKCVVEGYTVEGNVTDGSVSVILNLTEIEDYDTGALPALTVDGIDVEEFDGAAPVLLSATTVDGDGDNKVDGYDMIFTEPLDLTSVTTDKWDFNYDGRTSYSLDYAEFETVVYMTFTEDPDAFDTSSTPYLETVGEVDDLHGNDLALGEIIGIDGVSPVIADAYSDATEEGVLRTGDSITFTIELVDSMDVELFAEAEANASSSTYNGAELVWYQDELSGLITAIYTVGADDADQTTPLQLFNINVTDAEGNTAANVDITDVQKIIDANAPVVLNATTCDLNNNGKIDAYKIIFSEAVNDYSYVDCAVAGYSVLGGDTGETANDSILYLIFEEGGSYDTNVLPNITALEGAISDLAGNGIAAVGNDNITEEDGAAPAIISVGSIAYNDDGGPAEDVLGLNDWINFTVTPSTKDDVDFINTSTFNGVELVWTEELDGTWTATYTVLEGHTSSMDAQLTGVFATDEFGNAGLENVDEATYIINAGGPMIMEAFTMDANYNGLIDGYNVTFIDAINDSTLNITNWNVEGHTILSWDTGEAADDSNLFVYFDEIAADNTAALPNLTIPNPEVADLDGDVLNGAFCDEEGIVESDGAAPVLMYAYVDSDDSYGCEGYEIDVNFSEDVTGIEGNVSFKEGYESLYYDGYIIHMSSYEGTLWAFDYDGQLQTGDSPEITAINNMMDAEGNAAVLYGDSGVVVNTFRKEIVAGYNFISFPIADEGTVTLADVGLDIDAVESVWTYNPQDGWVFSIDGSFEVEGGVGYIVVATDDFILAPNVNNYPAEFESPALTTVYEGWNLVGHYKAHDQCTYGAFETLMPMNPIDTASLNSVMYEQRTAGELGLRELNAFSDDDRDVVTGNAYWINVDCEDGYSVGSSYGYWFGL